MESAATYWLIVMIAQARSHSPTARSYPYTTWKVILKAPQCGAFKITYF